MISRSEIDKLTIDLTEIFNKNLDHVVIDSKFSHYREDTTKEAVLNAPLTVLNDQEPDTKLFRDG